MADTREFDGITRISERSSLGFLSSSVSCANIQVKLTARQLCVSQIIFPLQSFKVFTALSETLKFDD